VQYDSVCIALAKALLMHSTWAFAEMMQSVYVVHGYLVMLQMKL